jgi:hypothetical protein
VRWTTERGPSRDFLLSAAVTVFLSTIWIWPHAAHLRQVPDRGDPVFSAWRLARFAHQLRHDPAHLFDGNIFYPRPYTLAYSDATLLEGAAAAPFIWAGADPLVVANGLFLIAFPLCGLAFFYAGWRLTGNPMAAVVTGVLGAWYPFHAEHYSHLELQWFMFVPLVVVAVVDTIVDPSWRRGLLVGALLALQCLASMYLGLMLATVLVPLTGVALLRYRIASVPRLLSALGAAAIVALPVAALLSIPYDRARAAHGERSVQEVLEGSATPGDYLKTPRRLATYAWHTRQFNRPERELYPGTSTLSLAAIGLLALPSGPALPLLAGGLAAFDWSLGLNGLTYRSLSALSPYKSIRVPARFAVLAGAALILLAGFGAHRIVTQGSGRRPLVLTIVLAATVLLDLRVKSELVDYYSRIPSLYEHITPDAVLAELPTGHEIDYMYFSTRHWAHLLSGYSGFIPADAGLAADLSLFPAPQSIDGLRGRGATHVTYNCAFERSVERCRHNQAELARNPHLEMLATEIWQGGSVQLYRLK